MIRERLRRLASRLSSGDRPMALSNIVASLRRTVDWPGYNHSWFERELTGAGMLVEAWGDRIHAVVVGMHGKDGTTYVDFSPCSAPCGAHGLPPEPREKWRPCLTFIVVTSGERILVRDETGPPETAEA